MQAPKNRQCVLIFQMAMFDGDRRHIASVDKVKDVPLGKFNDSSSKVQAKPIKYRHILKHPFCFGTMSGIPTIEVHRA